VELYGSELPIQTKNVVDVMPIRLIHQLGNRWFSSTPGSHNLLGYVTLVMVIPKCDSRSAARMVTVPAVMNAF